VYGWCADYPDPQNWLSVYWKTGAFAARIGYSNPAADALMTKGDTTLDPALRMQYYAEAQRMIIGDVPAVMMWNSVHTYMVKPWVVGFQVTPDDLAFPGDVDPLTIMIDTSKIP
jgi:oligopeptide transport system substrate-binding protein